MKCLFIAVLFVQANALIEWPFTMGNGGNVAFNLTVGNPPQSLSMGIGLTKDQDVFVQKGPGLYLLEPSEYKKHGFMPKRSRTFRKVKTNYYRDEIEREFKEVSGLDDFVIKSGTAKRVTLKNLPVKVLSNQFDSDAFLSLKYSRDGNTFLERLLSKQKERNVVIVPGKFSEDPYENSIGLLALGGRPKRCKNWKYVPEYKMEDENDQWNFFVDSVQIGDYTHTTPATASVFLTNYFEMPDDVYRTIRKELEVDARNNTDCNQSKKIVLTIGEKQLELDSTEYIQKYKVGPEAGNDYVCKIAPIETNDEYKFVLPMSVLRNQCFLLDFKRKRIGFADNYSN